MALLDATASDDELRARVRAWLERHARTRPRGDEGHDFQALQMARLEEDRDRTLAWARELQSAMYDGGLVGITWPVAEGGQGLDARVQAIVESEASMYDLPDFVFGIGQRICAPTLLAHGSAALRRRYLAPLARGDEIWCQLFSEPSAGSDLAGLRTRAVRDGHEWVVTGQKVWTSGGHYSDFGILLARTDPSVPKHAGITMFVCDMHAAGVTVRPLRQITGISRFNEVFLDDVRIPDDQVIGDVHGGWVVAMTTLTHERGGGAGGRRVDPVAPVLRLRRELGPVRSETTDASRRASLADLWIRGRVLELLRSTTSRRSSAGRAGAWGSVVKLASARLTQRAAEQAVDVAHMAGVAWEPGADDTVAVQLLQSRMASIAGGTDEIQRNVIGERILGLPREPQVDRDVPFDQVRQPG